MNGVARIIPPQPGRTEPQPGRTEPQPGRTEPQPGRMDLCRPPLDSANAAEQRAPAKGVFDRD